MTKTFIVTGASKGRNPRALLLFAHKPVGIGLAITKYLISASHQVIVVARSKALLEDLQKQNPKQVRALAGDLSEFGLAKQAVELAVDAFGALDGLIINHGAIFGVSRLESCDVEEWRKLFDINYFSAIAFVCILALRFRLLTDLVQTKAALPELRKTKGTIVITSSGASTGAYSGWGAYSASKAVLNSLAVQVACEERDVAAFAIRPGVVDTDMQKEVREVHSATMENKDNAKFRKAFEEGTILKPQQPGHVIAKLAVDPDTSLNGKYLR